MKVRPLTISLLALLLILQPAAAVLWAIPVPSTAPASPQPAPENGGIAFPMAPAILTVLFVALLITNDKNEAGTYTGAIVVTWLIWMTIEEYKAGGYEAMYGLEDSKLYHE